MKLEPFAPNLSRKKNRFYRCLELEAIVKHFTGENAKSECNLERVQLQLWHSYGIRVPYLIDVSLLPPGAYYLVQEDLGELTLRKYLAGQAHPAGGWARGLKGLIESVARRHQLALKHDEVRLIHADPNLDNILIKNGHYYFIDLESRELKGDTAACVAWELSRIVRNILIATGSACLREFADQTVDAYQDLPEVLELLIRMHYKNPWIQAMKDRLRGRSTHVRRQDFAAALKLSLRDAG